MPLELLTGKWDLVAIDLIVGMLLQDEMDPIYILLDKATKMSDFTHVANRL